MVSVASASVSSHTRPGRQAGQRLPYRLLEDRVAGPGRLKKLYQFAETVIARQPAED
jgi:hypothetical protein